MENNWTKINDDISKYMDKINEQYKMKYVKISQLKTAIIGKGFALIIAIDRFDASVSYLSKSDDKIMILLCDNYFAERYDENDRNGLLLGSGAEVSVINNLKIIDSGLSNKWREVLNGETDWLDNYNKSKWYAVGRLTPDEMKIIKEYI
jgi:hypothetical protein